MDPKQPAPVWLMAVADRADGSASGAGCQACRAPDVAQTPRLAGPAEGLQRVLQALRSVRNPRSGQDIVTEGWVGALRLDEEAGEAELGLWARQPGCGLLRGITEDAFNVLRTALPDTDLYVHELRA